MSVLRKSVLSIEEGRAERSSLKFGYFLSMSQQAISADIIPNSAAGLFSPKTKDKGTKTKADRVLIRWLPRKFVSSYLPT